MDLGLTRSDLVETVFDEVGWLSGTREVSQSHGQISSESSVSGQVGWASLQCRYLREW